MKKVRLSWSQRKPATTVQRNLHSTFNFWMTDHTERERATQRKTMVADMWVQPSWTFQLSTATIWMQLSLHGTEEPPSRALPEVLTDRTMRNNKSLLFWATRLWGNSYPATGKRNTERQASSFSPGSFCPFRCFSISFQGQPCVSTFLHAS